MSSPLMSELGEHAVSASQYDRSSDIEEEQQLIDYPFQFNRPNPQFKIPASANFTPPPSPPPRQSSPVAARLAPLLGRASSVMRRASPSPERDAASQERNLSAQSSSTPTSSTTASVRRKKGSRGAIPAFVELFQGNSAAMDIGFFQSPKREDAPQNSPFAPAASSRPGHTRRTSALQNAANFIGFPPKVATRQRPIKEEEEDDDDLSDGYEEDDDYSILDLDVEAELFPRGEPERVSQASFDELHSNALRLLTRMQAAYKDKCRALQAATAVSNVEKDELDEAHTRASHLKLQLDGMSAKVAEQNEAMKTLVDELATEKHRRRLEWDEKVPSIRLIDRAAVSPTPSEFRIFSRGSRVSYGQANEADEFGAESESESESETESIVSSRPTSSSDASISTTQDGVHAAVPVYQLPGSEHVALSTMSSAQRENMRLKARVAELEETVESCLGLVSGIDI